MDLETGTKIGPYVIEREIGRGGMGVVYLAGDPRLDRKVAIKALPEEMAQDPARLDRFEGEARSLALLNHPYVAGIHGLEEKDGHRFLVLEYVEGESLGDRLERGPLTVEEALETCIKIAAGIEAAHDAGVIHRDLKPDNVRITPDGEVKVLDFGLSKMDEGSSSSISDPSLPDTATQTAAMGPTATMPGVVLGTAAYMSPEQARGRRVDKRTDVWSFGVVLYECLAGAGPFVGETVSDSIGAILHKEVDLTRLPAGTPAMVRHVLRGCLERDRSLRYRDIGDVRIELSKALATPAAELPVEAARAGFSVRAVAGIAILATLIAAAVAWFAKPAPDPEPLPVVRAEISLPEGERLAHLFWPALAISPDGGTLAFFAGKEPEDPTESARILPSKILLRKLDQPVAVPVPGVEVLGAELTFSPDGQWLAFAGMDGVYKVPLTGGQPTKLCDTTGTRGLSWGEDGNIVMGHEGLRRVSAEGGAVEELTEPDTDAEERSHALPHVLPGSDLVLFTAHRFRSYLRSPDAMAVWALRLSTGERVRIQERASDARYVNGHVVFMREGDLYAATFDVDALEMTEEPRLVLEGVQHSVYTPNVGTETGAGMYALSRSGTLAYLPGSVFPETTSEVVLVDRAGNETPLSIEPRAYLTLRGSPDGRKILMAAFYPLTSAVWIHDLQRDISRRQRSDGIGLFASWGPGPDRITYDKAVEGGERLLLTKPVGGSASDETEIETSEDVWLGDWSLDGRHLLGVHIENRDLWVYEEGEGWSPIMETEGVAETWPALSPDGRWLAYSSDESGDTFHVFVRPFLRPGPTVQVSRSTAYSPVWSHDGSELYFRGQDSDEKRWIEAASISVAGDRLEAGRPVRLFEDVYGMAGPIRSWDTLGDRGFLVMPRGDESRQEYLDQQPDRFRIVQNWASLLD